MTRSLYPVRLYLACVAGVLSFAMAGGLQARNLEFTLHKLKGPQAGPVMLIVAGIQGDEPGGFNAASLLVTDYRIRRGEVWVVPNLNFESIIRRSRGVHGDMNRKFLNLPRDDPEYRLVNRIKSIILDGQVDVILNLHDGSGFYSPNYISAQRNPSRWGQSIIIDQARVEARDFGDLAGIARAVCQQVNRYFPGTGNDYHVKNTRTRWGNKDMEKTLTYFAVRHGKAAFGIEASKSFDTHWRAYYHLAVIEAMMGKLGIQYERPFDLAANTLKTRIDNNLALSLYQNRIFLQMADVRRRLGYVPLKKDQPLTFEASNPLVAVIGGDNHYKVRYGNRHVTQLHPQYFEFDNSLDSVPVQVDGQVQRVRFGEVINVRKGFKVLPQPGYRVNVIGFTHEGGDDDSGRVIQRKAIAPRFSVDKQARLFRVEVYQADKFCGMFLTRYARYPFEYQGYTPAVQRSAIEFDRHDG